MAEKLHRENGAPPRGTGARFDEVRGADREPYAQPPSRAEHGHGPTSQSLDRSADGLAQHLAELEGRAAAAELTQRDAGSPGSNDLSREELEVQQQIAALEREHLERGDGGPMRRHPRDANGGEEPGPSGTDARAGRSQTELFMEQRRAQ